jgi:hypothetical protein
LRRFFSRGKAGFPSETKLLRGRTIQMRLNRALCCRLPRWRSAACNDEGVSRKVASLRLLALLSAIPRPFGQIQVLLSYKPRRPKRNYIRLRLVRIPYKKHSMFFPILWQLMFLFTLRRKNLQR